MPRRCWTRLGATRAHAKPSTLARYSERDWRMALSDHRAGLSVPNARHSETLTAQPIEQRERGALGGAIATLLDRVFVPDDAVAHSIVSGSLAVLRAYRCSIRAKLFVGQQTVRSDAARHLVTARAVTPRLDAFVSMQSRGAGGSAVRQAGISEG